MVITANEQVWLQVKDGATTLKEGLLEAGQSFEVPPTAQAPVLMTGKPEAIRISVGTADAPPVGSAAQTVRNVSLLGADLMRGPAPAAATPATTPAPAPAARAPRTTAPRRPAIRAPSAPAARAPATAAPPPVTPPATQNTAG